MCAHALSTDDGSPLSSLPSTYTALSGCVNARSGVPPISTATHTASYGVFAANAFQSECEYIGRLVHVLVVSALDFSNRAPTVYVNAAPSWYADRHSVPWLASFLPPTMPTPKYPSLAASAGFGTCATSTFSRPGMTSPGGGTRAGGSARRSREMSRVFLSARNSSGVSSSTTAHPSNSACWYRARHRPISTPSNSSSAPASSPVRYATPGGRNTRFPLRAVEPG